MAERASRGEPERSRGRRVAVAALACLLAVAAAAVTTGNAIGQDPDPTGKSTVDQTIFGDPNAAFSLLDAGPGDPIDVREELGAAEGGRDARRESLFYFGQISDFHLTDEESPARVEFFDAPPLSSFSNSGHRPHEALIPHEVDATVRQMNQFQTSPIPQGDGTRAEMVNVVLTGDLADSQQRNEVEWVRTLIEGGTLNPNSGTSQLGPLEQILCGLAPLDDPQNYTGVQDYDDYFESPLFYDPDQPAGPYAGWPSYPGLQDRAQVPFTASGLNVPSYVAVGNHDVLVQGNEDANALYELVATGCLKPMGPFPDGTSPQDTLDPAYLLGLLATSPEKVAQVPPDANRQYVDKAQYRQVMAQGNQPDAHGFGFVDPSELSASNGAASYYSFSPEPGLRFIALDTNSSGSGFLLGPGEEGGVATTAEGNIDHPQWQWLIGELEQAKQDEELVVAYAHHGIGSLTFALPDEIVSPCLTNDAHGHDVNPGCDRDPRNSGPVHLGSELTNLLNQYPGVITFVAGHSHDNRVIPRDAAGPGKFWEVKTAAVADWPSQSRVLDVMDNCDGTLSIFGVLLDTLAPIDPPAAGTSAATFGVDELSSIGRVLNYNDPQAGPGAAEGEAGDRNVELLIDNPYEDSTDCEPPPPPPPPPGSKCAGGITGDEGDNELIGTAGPDRIRGLGGDDLIRGRKGADCLNGDDGNDELHGGGGPDVLWGGDGDDEFFTVRGTRDVIHCGPGNDTVHAGVNDVVGASCENVTRGS